MQNQFVEIPASKASIAKRKLVHGTGINDAEYIIRPTSNGSKLICPYYSSWSNMIARCYSDKFKSKRPTYEGCSVCDEWLTFSTFKRWMKTRDWVGKELDKDIVTTGNKIYSPSTCIFISRHINTIMNSCGASRGLLPKGVCFDKRCDNFLASCSVVGNKKFLGRYKTASEASNAYRAFKSSHVASVALGEQEPLRGYLIRISNELLSQNMN